MSFFKKTGKILAVLLGLSFAFSAVACGGGNSSSSDGSSSSSSTPGDSSSSGDIPGGDVTGVVTEAAIAPQYQKISDEVLQNEYKTFYFDAELGDDENSGANENSPKQSLSEIPEIIANYANNYPIRILLKRGSTFYENVKLAGYTATEDRPLIMDAYGEGTEYPVIHGNGTIDTYTTVLHLEEGNTRIYNLEITGPECAKGIYVLPRKGGHYENIVIEGCYVHEVNWLWNYDTEPDETDPDDIDPEEVCPTGTNNRFRRLYGGIAVFTGDPSNSAGAPISIHNIWIQNNLVEEVAHVGINFYNYWVNRPGVGYGYNKFVDSTTEYNNYETGVGYFPFENVVVKGNKTNCVGGDGIILAGADNSWLEYNVSYKSNYLGRAGFWNGGLWVHNVRNCYYQYNEAGYTYLRHGSSDGEGFDIDNTCENTYMQYNYAHHNEGGGVLLCNLQTSMLKFNPDGTPATERLENYWGDWKNNYIRNNVFVDNGTALNTTKSAFVTIARAVNGVVVENNTVIMSGAIKNQHIIECEDNVLASDHVYRNNIFYCADANANPVFEITVLKNPVFENNLYYNIKDGDPLYGQLPLSADAKAITGVDPQFASVSDYNGLEKAYQFMGANAALYTSGIASETKMKYDFKGNDATQTLYLGAFAKKA